MRSQTDSILDPPTATNLPNGKFDDLSKFQLKEAQAISIPLPEGLVLVQSIDHYVVNIQLYEYRINSHCVIDLEITEPSFLMTAMPEGCSVLYDDQNNMVSEISGNACRLTYLPAGKYQKSLLSGHHQILELTIKPDWLIKKYGNQEEMQALLNQYNNNKEHVFTLPSFNLGQFLFSALAKLNDGTDIDIDVLIFMNNCLGRYYHKLHTRMSKAWYQEHKAKEIGQFVIRNFASKLVENEQALASHLMVSAKTLARLAKLYFGAPLRKQVIELRLHYGLKMLLNSNKSIKEIAASVGYNDALYFTKSFKNRFGVPPNDIRLSVF